MGIQDQAPQPLSSALPATPMFSTLLPPLPPGACWGRGPGGAKTSADAVPLYLRLHPVSVTLPAPWRHLRRV